MQLQSTGFRIIGFTVAVCFFAIATRGGAQTKFERLHVGYSAQAGSLAPIWITKEAGVFKKHGLDVELLFIPGGPTGGSRSVVWRGSYFGRRRASHCKQ
jgi:ABC-type nitrate/sulfonate/bicarbonate transport system substrate-binding protein